MLTRLAILSGVLAVAVCATGCGATDTNATDAAANDGALSDAGLNDAALSDARPNDAALDSPGDASATSDAGNADAPSPARDSGASATDGGNALGLVSDPGAITCGARTCPDAGGSPPMNEVRAYCCTLGPNTGDPLSQTCEYANLGACESGDPYYCDETADCNAGLVCCMSDDLRPWTACASTCTGVVLCKSSAECTNGQACTPVTCDGQRIGTCGPLSARLAQAFGCQ